MNWIKTSDQLPDNQQFESNRYYMVYAPQLGQFQFKCQFRNGRFRMLTSGTVIFGSWYRLAVRGDVDKRLTNRELAELNE